MVALAAVVVVAQTTWAPAVAEATLAVVAALLVQPMRVVVAAAHTATPQQTVAVASRRLVRAPPTDMSSFKISTTSRPCVLPLVAPL